MAKRTPKKKKEAETVETVEEEPKEEEAPEEKAEEAPEKVPAAPREEPIDVSPAKTLDEVLGRFPEGRVAASKEYATMFVVVLQPEMKKVRISKVE